jgi:ParB family chromosome partitioning protein
MTAKVHHIPLDHIATDALTRDRTGTDLEPLLELRASILASGVRMPIEVFHLAEPQGELAYGLISGFRRLAAVRSLRDDVFDGSRFTDIPAFIREPADLTEAMTAMVEENAIRAEVSAWEQAQVAVTACERGTFDTVDAAMDTLYRNLNREKRRRLRQVAHLIEQLDGSLTAPETWSLRRLLRLAAAVSRGYGPLVAHALLESSAHEAEHQWRVIQPILIEAETPDIPAPSRDAKGVERPRRTWRSPIKRIRVRRELSPDGWCLHITGPDAHGSMIDLVFFHIEQLLSPQG